jgi:hypothetical protein
MVGGEGKKRRDETYVSGSRKALGFASLLFFVKLGRIGVAWVLRLYVSQYVDSTNGARREESGKDTKRFKSRLGTERIKDIAQARQRIGLATTCSGGKTRRVGGG